MGKKANPPQAIMPRQILLQRGGFYLVIGALACGQYRALETAFEFGCTFSTVAE
jgi:hypothetical protein